MCKIGGMYMKKLWNSLKLIVYSYMAQYILIVFSLVLFAVISGNNEMFSDYDSIYEIAILGTVITSVLISIYLYRKYKTKGNRLRVSKLLLMIPLGMGISLFYNMLTINWLNNEVMEINKILLYSYIVIVGPVFEEIVFRYVGLKFAKKEYSEKKAIIIVSILFALLHSGIFNIIYAFLIGVILSYIYIKYKNIMYPILLHISANLMSLLITGFNAYALIISAIVLVFMYIYLRKEDHV